MFETGTATHYVDLIDKLNTFLTANGSAFGKTYAGTGTGTLHTYRGGASSVAETFTITATSATSFTVVGSLAGSIGPATVGTPFSHSKIAFTLAAGGTAFVAGDVFTISTAPKWTQLRRAKGCELVASSGNSGQRAVQNLVDGKVAPDDTRVWDAAGAPNEWIEVQFFEEETFVEWALGAYQAGVDNLTLQRWNGSAWVDLDVRTGLTWSTDEVKIFQIASPVAASLYRVNLSDSSTVGGAHLLEFRRTVGGFPASYGEVIWKAPGNDGDSEIFVGIHSFMRPDVDYHDWELASFDGYNAAARFTQQPGFHGQVYVPLWREEIDYWFIADGRRVIVIAKIGTQYESAYLGLYDSYFTPNQAPYPMALGGSLALLGSPPFDWDEPAFRYSTTTDRHSAFTHSDAGSGSIPKPLIQHQLQVRRLDGAWDGFAALESGLVGNAPHASVNQIWPYRNGIALLDPNVDGSYALWPIMLNQSPPNTLGQLAGVYAISGQGLSAESLVQLGAIDFMAVPNIYRVDRDDFFVVGLD